MKNKTLTILLSLLTLFTVACKKEEGLQPASSGTAAGNANTSSTIVLEGAGN